MVKTIKKVFDSKYFHGRLTDEEAYNLCKEEMTNHGKPEVYLWYICEIGNGKLQGEICGYRRDLEVPFHIDRRGDVQQFQPLIPPFTPQYVANNFNTTLELNSWDFVERKNPHKVLELARVATLDNCNGYCCLTSLEEKMDEFRIPASEKEELKKLVRGFHFDFNLVENLPNELCIHN